MNPPPSTESQTAGECWSKPNDFLPMRRPDPVSPRRKNRPAGDWWNSPTPARGIIQDPFKTEKEATHSKVVKVAKPAVPFVLEDDVPNPVESDAEADATVAAAEEDTSVLSAPRPEEAQNESTSVPDAIQIETLVIEPAVESAAIPQVIEARQAPQVAFVQQTTRIENWKSNDFLPMRRPAPVSPRRKTRGPSSWQSPRPGVVEISESSDPVESKVVDFLMPAPFTENIACPPPSISVDEVESDSEDDESESVVLEAPEEVAPVTDEVVTVETDLDSVNASEAANEDEEVTVETELESVNESGNESGNDIDSDSDNDSYGTLDSLAQPLVAGLTKSLGDLHCDLWGEEELEAPVDVRHYSASSLDHANSIAWEQPKWAQKKNLKTTGLKTEGNLAKPVTFPEGKGDGINREVQPKTVLTNKGVAPTEPAEKMIEWERPDWATSLKLKATGKADILKTKGNLAKPITFPFGKGGSSIRPSVEE